ARRGGAGTPGARRAVHAAPVRADPAGPGLAQLASGAVHGDERGWAGAAVPADSAAARGGDGRLRERARVCVGAAPGRAGRGTGAELVPRAGDAVACPVGPAGAPRVSRGGAASPSGAPDAG